MTSPKTRRYVLLTVALGSSLAPFMVAGVTVAVPTIGSDFTLDPVTLSWVPTAFFLAAAMFLIPFGRVADIYGVKKVYRAGMYVYFLSALLAAAAPAAPFLIAARFLTGVGAAMIFGTSFALLSLALPETERGAALGVNIAASFGGFALGFLGGGVLTYYLSWRVIFLLVLPVVLAVLALVRLKLTGECALSWGRHLDVPGIALNVIMLLLIMVGFSTLPDFSGVAALAAGLALLAAFAVWELKTESPILDLRLLTKNRLFTLANASVLVYTTSSFAALYLFSLYLQYIRGFDPRMVGLVLLGSTLITVLFVGYSGRLSDRISPHIVASAGIAATSLGFLPMLLLRPATPLAIVLFSLVMLAAGLAFFQPPLYNTVLGAIGREMYGVASGFVETMRLLGMTISMAITIIVFALSFGMAEITPEYHPVLLESMRLIFLALFLLSLASLAVTIAMGRSIPEKRPGVF